MERKKILIITVIVLLVILVGSAAFWYWPKEDGIKATFTCKDNKSIKAVFYGENTSQVKLTLSDGRKMVLDQAISASGARYANADESFVFWNKGNTAFVTENGENTYENCFVKGSEALGQIQSISDGNITVFYNQDFGLAVTKEQILVTSYIPACDDNFDYCLYYYKDTYKGTNFESAGIRIKKRADLNSTTCLVTPPEGFDTSKQSDGTSSNTNYSASVFSNVGGAGAGHYAVGSLYRVYIKKASSCYEFETRIGETQFANYPTGAIKQFTDLDKEKVTIQLTNLLEGIIVNGTDQNLQLP